MSEASGVITALAENLADQAIAAAVPEMAPAEVREILLKIADSLGPSEPVIKRGASAGTRAILYTDGASRGNPGRAAAGASLVDPAGREILAGKWYLGQMTNNAAEYLALIHGLTETRKLAVRELEVRMDSELVVRQLTGVYRVKDPQLKKYHAQVMDLLAGFGKVRITHVPRAENRRADELANQALDARG